MSYDKAYGALRRFEPKALYMTNYFDACGCCALGALLRSEGVEKVTFNTVTICALMRQDPDVQAAVLRTGLTKQEARELQKMNDRTYDSPEARYEAVLDWLRGQAS